MLLILKNPSVNPIGAAAEAGGSSNRAFGLVFCGFFTVIGLLPWLHDSPPRRWALISAGVCGALAVMYPRALAILNRIWTRFGLLLHSVTSPVALFLIYALAVIPVGLVMRVLGKDPLLRSYDSAAKSYWIPREPPGRADVGMKNQF